MDWSTEVSVAINYPYTLNIDGKVITSSDSNKIYLDRVLTLLSTNVGQRPMLPDYGCDIYHALFENDNNIEQAVNQAVRSAIGSWLPAIQVMEVLVGQPNEDGISNVEIRLKFPDGMLTSLVTSTAIFMADGTIKRSL